MTILGLDVLPDRQNFYAVILDETTGDIHYRNTVKREDIILLIKKYNVKIVAMDNIFELYETSADIMNFIDKTGVTLVQVTGAPFRQHRLASLAKKHGLFRGGKLPPEKAAEIAARLAMRSEGAQVIALRDATLITVSRSRHFGQVGGSHQRQYLRSAEARIREIVKEILDSLNKQGILYDTLIREGEGGYKSARIIIYESYDTIRNIIRDYETDWYQVKVEPIRHSRLIFVLPGEGHSPFHYGHYIIVGVDPGETTGLALIDLNGNVLYVGSRRGIGFFELIDKIYEHGKPLIISTDVPKIPHFVNLLSQKSGAIIFRPKKTLSIFKKNEIIKNLGIRVHDSHQRDALVAAFLAYKHYEKKFSKIDSILKYIPIVDPEKVKVDVVFRNLDIRTAILSQLSELLSERNKEKSDYISHREVQLLRENQQLRKKYVELRKKVAQMRETIHELRESLRQKEREIIRLKSEIRTLSSAKKAETIDILREKDHIVAKLLDENRTLTNIVTKLESKIKYLENKHEVLRRIAQRNPSEIVVKKIEKLSYSSLITWKNEYGLSKYDFILTKNITWSEKLINLLSTNAAGIIIYGDEKIPEEIRQKLAEVGIVVLKYDDVSDIIDTKLIVQTVQLRKLRKRIRGVILEYTDKLEKAYEEFMEVLEEYRRKRIVELMD